MIVGTHNSFLPDKILTPMLFKNILLPVDFSINTEIAVKKAVELVQQEDAIIHLLHVVSPLSTWGGITMYPFHAVTRAESYEHIQEDYSLQKLKSEIESCLPQVQIETILAEGGIQNSIIEAAKTLRTDLIIIGKHHRQRLLPLFTFVSPDRIARSSDCPVLTVKPGSVDQKIKSIVVPIGKFVPKRKIELLSDLSKKFHATIHLVTLQKESTVISMDATNALLQTYRMLKGRGLVAQLVHTVMHGNNLAKASLDYAESILADMILVNPETETKLSSFTGLHITDRLLNNSKLQVLEVEPYRILNF